MAHEIKSNLEPEPWMIQRFRKETHDTFTLELSSSKGNQPFLFKPGQFNMLYMYGVGEVPISISGDPLEPGKIVHTVRAYGSVTGRMLTLRKGDVIGIRGPFGNHWPIEDLTGQDLLLVAGGIGIAPLRPVLYHVLSEREQYGNVTFLYGERTPEDLIFKSQVEQWRGRFDLEIDVTVDRASEEWHGNVGVVTGLISRLSMDPERTSAMLCGPEIMMYYAIQELENKGIPDDRVYISMERNMKCGIGSCGHCQVGPTFMFREVVNWHDIWMLEFGNNFGFSFKSVKKSRMFHKCRMQRFNRYVSVQAGMVSLKSCCHAPLSQFFN